MVYAQFKSYIKLYLKLYRIVTTCCYDLSVLQGIDGLHRGRVQWWTLWLECFSLRSCLATYQGNKLLHTNFYVETRYKTATNFIQIFAYIMYKKNT